MSVAKLLACSLSRFPGG
jgi:hypothetical protein